ncbi:hypothetical protein ZYGR_0A02590 [Zygosaccharomyces rouxii]|uniref:ZYRO0A05896p n=2 Tax=Zygosaccharomyces rouxii TaxID=4956 RepID=C5DPT2_ZYGRC|nr:uncharacterized protein ZYRO0A05896g [Zygosaccharomyces rouxii]KAH9198786.1 histidine phosphatase superfamily [Zygosaccharomyces rouxii]GAV46666.1 hypothetical protein ZYGR_0A02590 [Zygosaccharomyces rouxii]CAR25693.1 ZYRO0A05896p [Zygosaccharomyces rouxii]
MTVSSFSEACDGNVVRLFVIRHGQTDYNIRQIMQGHKDIELNQTGFEQATLLGKRLVEDSLTFDSVASSDLIRCKQTVATALATSNQNLPVTYYYELRERCMGVIEGMQIDQAEKFAVEQGKKSFRDFGETPQEFIGRFATCFVSVAEQAAANNHKNVAIFTHGGSIRSLLSWLHYNTSSKIPNTSVTVIDYHKDTKQFEVKVVADDMHLTGGSGSMRFVGDSRVL